MIKKGKRENDGQNKTSGNKNKNVSNNNVL